MDNVCGTRFLSLSQDFVRERNQSNMLEQNNPENLKQIIDHIVKSTQIIEARDFDETATKQFVVLPILRGLGWDDRNLETLEVLSEIPTDPESSKQINEVPSIFQTIIS